MKPVLHESKIHKKLWVVYIIIFLICTIGMGIVLYLQYYKDEKVEIVFGITGSDSEELDKYNELKANFNTIFTNEVANLPEETIDVEKINQDYDIVVTAYEYQKDDENINLNVKIPYININNNIVKKIDQQIRTEYKDMAEMLLEQTEPDNIVYSVEYVAYIQNDILSLVIRSGYREGDKSQKVIIKTYNYNIVEKKEVSIDDLLKLKNISEETANNKIFNEIKEIQEQNEPLIEQGYNFYSRDYNSDIYKINNAEQYFLGKDGMLYIVYSYGIKEDTSETDIVIFK